MCQSTAGLALAADALVLTVYYKLADDLADERFFKRLPALVLWPFLSRMRKKAAVRRPALDETLREQTAAQQALERRASKSADRSGGPHGPHDGRAVPPGRAGQPYAGAHGPVCGEDHLLPGRGRGLRKGHRNGAYNVFALQGLSKAEAVAEAQRLCRMCAGEAALALQPAGAGAPAR